MTISCLYDVRRVNAYPSLKLVAKGYRLHLTSETARLGEFEVAFGDGLVVPAFAAVAFVHSTVWTGDRMIVWGGAFDFGRVRLNSGAAYDPRTALWTTLPPARGLVTERTGHVAVWTGSQMIVWGGFETGHEMCSSWEAPWSAGGIYTP